MDFTDVRGGLAATQTGANNGPTSGLPPVAEEGNVSPKAVGKAAKALNEGFLPRVFFLKLTEVEFKVMSAEQPAAEVDEPLTAEVPEAVSPDLDKIASAASGCLSDFISAFERCFVGCIPRKVTSKTEGMECAPEDPTLTAEAAAPKLLQTTTNGTSGCLSDFISAFECCFAGCIPRQVTSPKVVMPLAPAEEGSAPAATTQAPAPAATTQAAASSSEAGEATGAPAAEASSSTDAANTRGESPSSESSVASAGEATGAPAGEEAPATDEAEASSSAPSSGASSSELSLSSSEAAAPLTGAPKTVPEEVTAPAPALTGAPTVELTAAAEAPAGSVLDAIPYVDPEILSNLPPFQESRSSSPDPEPAPAPSTEVPSAPADAVPADAANSRGTSSPSDSSVASAGVNTRPATPVGQVTGQGALAEASQITVYKYEAVEAELANRIDTPNQATAPAASPTPTPEPAASEEGDLLQRHPSLEGSRLAFTIGLRVFSGDGTATLATASAALARARAHMAGLSV